MSNRQVKIYMTVGQMLSEFVASVAQVLDGVKRRLKINVIIKRMSCRDCLTYCANANCISSSWFDP